MLVYCIEMWGAGQAPRELYRIANLAGNNNMSGNSFLLTRHGLFYSGPASPPAPVFHFLPSAARQKRNAGGKVFGSWPVAINKQGLPPGSD